MLKVFVSRVKRRIDIRILRFCLSTSLVEMGDPTARACDRPLVNRPRHRRRSGLAWAGNAKLRAIDDAFEPLGGPFVDLRRLQQGQVNQPCRTPRAPIHGAPGPQIRRWVL